jgi:NAD(P)-dependent dehydrogenase (short-subunit alcohol dehydrogenase family)
VRVFEAAVQNSPHKSCYIVIANAGIVGPDDLYTLQRNSNLLNRHAEQGMTICSIDPYGPLAKPNLNIVEINLIGTIYTTKLAMHYFRRQPLDASRDRCLIIKASIAAYIDNAGSPQYNISKFGARALMRNLRRTVWEENIRVNLVAPW